MYYFQKKFRIDIKGEDAEIYRKNYTTYITPIGFKDLQL